MRRKSRGRGNIGGEQHNDMVNDEKSKEYLN